MKPQTNSPQPSDSFFALVSWVGWVFDTVRNELSIEPEKCAKCIRLFEEVLQADASGTLPSSSLARFCCPACSPY
eukprot:1514296-Pyramimonas_sp.AAC.1